MARHGDGCRKVIYNHGWNLIKGVYKCRRQWQSHSVYYDNRSSLRSTFTEEMLPLFIVLHDFPSCHEIFFLPRKVSKIWLWGRKFELKENKFRYWKSKIWEHQRLSKCHFYFFASIIYFVDAVRLGLLIFFLFSLILVRYLVENARNGYFHLKFAKFILFLSCQFFRGDGLKKHKSEGRIITQTYQCAKSNFD